MTTPTVNDQTAWDAIKAIRAHFAAHLDVARADGNDDQERGARELLAHLDVLRVQVEYAPDNIIAAIEADRAQRGLIEAVAEALDDRGAHAAAQLARDTDPEDDLWNNYLGPMLDELEEDYGFLAGEMNG